MSANTRVFLAAALVLSACTPPTTQNPVQTASSSSAVVSSAVSSVEATLPTEQGSTTSVVSATAPDRVTLDVPFSPQAPFAVWDPIHEEACEEMSLIMAMHYVRGDRSLSREQAEKEVQELIAWETAQGYGYDVTAAELGVIAQKFYELNARTRDDVTEESIKEELAAGRPVIVPAAGRELGNPYFSGEGPWYHMLVITGYREGLFGTIFITNDPGTRRGESYEYKADVLLGAIHDWTGVKEETNQGKKTMLMVTIQD